MMQKNNDHDIVQSWNYADDADITFGEVHESKLPKVILAFTLIGIVVLGVAAFLFRNFILDYINNPQLEFNEKVTLVNERYTVEAEISNSQFFNPNSYIAGYDQNTGKVSNIDYEYTIDDSNFNPNTTGTYTIYYHSSNRVRSEDYELDVVLKDKTPPTITLELDKKKPYHVDLTESGAYQLVLIRGKDTTNFDPKNYIKSVTDNYTKDPDKIKIEYPSNINFSSHTVDVIYSATDEAGNMDTVSLTLIIEEDIDALKQKQEEELKKAEEERLRIEEEKQKLEDEKQKQNEKDKDKDPDNGNDDSSSQGGGNNPGGGGNNQQPVVTQPVVTQPPPVVTTPEPSSISAKDVTISLSACGYDENYIAQQCINALVYRGSTGVASPSGMPGWDIPLDPGVYTVTWTTTDGLSCTQKLTLTD